MSTAADRVRDDLRIPTDGRRLLLGALAGFLGVLVIELVAAALGLGDSFVARLAIAVVLGLVAGLVLRLGPARGRRRPVG